MKKIQNEKLIGILHKTHREHGILISTLEDGTGSIKICAKDLGNINDGDLGVFDNYTLVEEEQNSYYTNPKGTHHIKYIQVEQQPKECITFTKEVYIFILRKTDLHGNAVIINENLTIKGNVVLVTFENEITADRYPVPSGYKIQVDDLWDHSKVIKERYIYTILGKVDLWERSNPLISSEVGGRIIKLGIILYKITTTKPTLSVHIMCREATGKDTFVVELGWERGQMLGLLPGALVYFKDVMYTPTRRTMFGTKGTFIYDATKSDYAIVKFSTQEYYDALRPRCLPRFSNDNLWGRPRMTLFEFNRFKPTSECTICCNIAAVKYLGIFSSVPYFRGVMAAVFDDGTDVWNGRIENEVLQKLLSLTETDWHNWEWSCRLNIIVKGERITNIDLVDHIGEAKYLLENL